MRKESINSGRQSGEHEPICPNCIYMYLPFFPFYYFLWSSFLLLGTNYLKGTAHGTTVFLYVFFTIQCTPTTQHPIDPWAIEMRYKTKEARMTSKCILQI